MLLVIDKTVVFCYNYKENKKFKIKGVIKMLLEKIKQDMISALKSGDKEKKDTLSLLVSALNSKAKEKLADLTEAEELSVLQKELKQTKETLDYAGSDRTDIIDKCNFRISVIESYLPKQMDETDIRNIIDEVVSSLSIVSVTKSDKGRIMKDLMPKVKGKADGKLVNSILETYFN